MKLRIACKSLEIIKDDNKVLIGLGIEKSEKRHHARALQEIPAARHIVGEYGSHVITMFSGILTATMLLAIKP
ncbi:MAG: hypothetical protein AAFX52_11960 [Pseudomonadota bacterium]